MKQYLQHDPWRIIEEGFHPDYNRITESIFSIGNGRMGQRANFEEHYSGDSFQGSYIAGVYYPDKTRVGWWKNGYPEYFAKVLNATNWIGIDLNLNDTPLDLATCTVTAFRRVLNMQKGYLKRSFTATMPNGAEVVVKAKRFCSIADDELGVIEYELTPRTDVRLTISPYLDADVANEDSNYDEKFWTEVQQEVYNGGGVLTAETRKTHFQVCTGMHIDIHLNGEPVSFDAKLHSREKYIANEIALAVGANQTVTIYKYAANLSSENHPTDQLSTNCKAVLDRAVQKGYAQLLQEQEDAWLNRWKMGDISIEGDVSAQQAIRFNIFQLHQTYTGEDERLNIGPKGFTGEKYGGSTYWDTEAYCLPFYLSTAPQEVARNLLRYRYKHLPKAIENAEKLGFTNGAALYPMVTMNGEECHNEWEITFEEIHRNGAIAYAIYDYIRYTGDEDYLIDYGLEVLIAITRFWSQRVHYATPKQQYVMHGVTGPNEYENNVNNNWYTSLLACWCMEYTETALNYVRNANAARYAELVQQLQFDETVEVARWRDIRENMYLPEDKELGIFLQQEGYLDKEQGFAADLNPAEVPIWQHWSWDRILRSCYIKQADVLQGIYLLEERFDEDTIRRNFNFYEPRTVHESSLSPCVHSILAARLGYHQKAYEMYLRTARLDLDDYNNDTEDGCHITSMSGTWMTIVKGFGGMRVYDNQVYFSPFIPEQWQAYAFRIRFRGHLLSITVTHDGVTIYNDADHPIQLFVFGQLHTVEQELKVAK